jgi:predicted O-methyltransferase YrrM
MVSEELNGQERAWPPLFSNDEESSLWQSMEGWVTQDGAHALYRNALKAGVTGSVVEIGNYAGKSTTCIARAVKAMNELFNLNRNLVAIDSGRHQQFGTNLEQFGVHHLISSIDNTSLDAVVSWREPISFLFIDANHLWPYVYSDFVVWETFLQIGGVIALDDVAGAIFPGPVLVAEMALASGAYDFIESSGGIAFLRKRKHFSPVMAAQPLSVNRMRVSTAHVSMMTGAIHPDLVVPLYPWENARQGRERCSKYKEILEHLQYDEQDRSSAERTVSYLNAVIDVQGGHPELALATFLDLSEACNAENFIHYSLPIVWISVLRLAQCHDLMGDRPRAIDAYRRLLSQCSLEPLCLMAQRGTNTVFAYPEEPALPLLRDYALAHPLASYEIILNRADRTPTTRKCHVIF